MKGFERFYSVRGELEAEQNCSILTPTLMTITAFISRSPGLLNRGPGGPASLRHVPHSSIFSPTDCTFCAPSYTIIWRPLFFLRASQFCTQFNLSTVKVISWYSSTGCNCNLHKCIFYFDSLAGSEVNIQHLFMFLQSTILSCNMILVMLEGGMIFLNMVTAYAWANKYW